MFALGYEKRGQRARDQGRRVESGGPDLSLSLCPMHAPMYACIGLAALAKGPVGVLLPLAAMGLFLLVTRRLAESVSLGLVDAALHGAGHCGGRGRAVVHRVGRETHWEWPRKFFLEFNLRPFKQPILSHGDVSFLNKTLAVFASIAYYFYYIPAILYGFFPWSVFMVPTLLETSRCIRRRDDQGSGIRGQGSDLFGGMGACWRRVGLACGLCYGRSAKPSCPIILCPPIRHWRC